jgi:hypothetical protein
MQRDIAALISLGIIIALFYITIARRNCFRMHLVSPDEINETLVVDGHVCNHRALFLIDTGYAGPPVLSASYLAVRDEDQTLTATVRDRYAHMMRTLSKNVSAPVRDAAVEDLIQEGACIAYTSGCTMRLMSIGDTQEQQADMLLCPPIMMRRTTGQFSAPTGRVVSADVVVTNALPLSIHILTCDYLLHASPTLLDIARGRIEFRLDPMVTLSHRAGMTMYPLEMNGGAFVVPIELGGQLFRVTIDTGAPGPVTLGNQAAARLTACMSTKRALTQAGVNGEHVCSDIVVTSMLFANRTAARVPVFVNNRSVEGVDGYVGLGILRAFNILITSTELGLVGNGLELRDAESYLSATSSQTCANTANACAR